MIRKIIYTALALIIAFQGISAQDQGYRFEGLVLDPVSGTALEGAVVTVTGLTSSVKTNQEGKFSVVIPSATATVTTWFPGFYEDVQPVSGRRTVTIVLIPVGQKGYTESFLLPFRTASPGREKYTNLSSISKKDIAESATQIEQTISAIPGLQVIGKSGMPGEGSFFSIRGVNSLTAGTSPLMVVNGVPLMPDMNESGIIGGFSKSVFNAIHPHDIRNITVLKGVDASRYGSLGANGVILIETDKATDLDTRVELISKFGFDMNQSRLPVMGVKDYKSYIANVALSRYDDMAEILDLFPYLVDNPDYFHKYLYNNNTNWQDYIYSPALTTDHVLKIKGGDAIAKYDLSIGYKHQGGQINNTGYTRYFARINSDVNLSRKISMFSSISMAYHDYIVQEQGMLDATNPMLAAMKKGPLFSPFQKDKDNNLLPDLAIIRNQDNQLITNNMVSNPLAIVNSLQAYEHGYDVQINAGVNYQINNHLKFSGLAGLYYYLSRQNVFVPGITQRTIMPLNNMLAINTVRSAEGTTTNTYFNLNLDYHNTFDAIHDVKARVGSQIAQNYTEYDAGTGYNTANDFYKTLNNVVSSSRTYFGYIDVWNWLNFNADVQYLYNHQVAVGLGLTADASSASGPDAPMFQLYPSLNVAWLTKNSLLSEYDFIDKLNLRAEIFSTGNSRFSSSLSKYHYINKVFRELSGLVRAGVPNTEIVPERNTTASMGIDASFHGNRFDITLDMYNTRNSNLIMPVSISSAFGVNYLYSNVATTNNTGIEFGVKASVIRTKDLNWYVGATLSSNADKVISLGGQDEMVLEMEDGSAIRTKVGEQVYAFYGYQTRGIIASSTQAATAGKDGQPLRTFVGTDFQPGDVLFVDQNNDGVIDDRDRVNLGSAKPKFYGNLNTAIRYKDIEVSAVLAYSYGNKMYNAVRRSMESMSDFGNQLITVNRRWTYDGQQTDMPRANYGDPMGNSRFSDRWIEDASFIKLKELMLTYHLKDFMKGTTIFVAGENLLTLTNYLGYDPETMYSYDVSMRGFDYAKVGHPRSVKLGFKIQF